MKSLLLTSLLLLATMCSVSQDWKTYPHHQEGTFISFPEDEGVHLSEPTDWWYLIGHATGDSTGDYYSFMLTYFHHEDLGFDGFRIFNLTNETKDLFYPQTLPVLYPLLAEDSLNIVADPIGGSIETWKNKTAENGRMIPFMYEVSAKQEHGELHLDLDTYKRPLVLGDSGFFYQGGKGNYTYYYSQTGIALSGTVTIDSATEKIAGTGWIDRQYGTFSASTGEAYEWFSAQLSNGVDINFWNIFSEDYRIYDTSTYKMSSVYVNDSTAFSTTDFTLERMKYVYTPDSVNCYSQQWNYSDENAELVLTVLNHDREVQVPFRFYEGALSITGTFMGEEVTGQGFAELLHSYQAPQLSFTNPLEDATWTGTGETITWHLENPDDGNPVYYSLSYTDDNGQNEKEIATSLTDTSYYWNFETLPDSNNYLLILRGSSIDGTLFSEITSPLVTIINTTDVPENFENHTVSIFPNPATGLVTVSSKDIQSVHLLDIGGKQMNIPLVKETIENEYILNLSSLNSGIYLLRITTVDETLIRKIVKR